MDTLADVIGDLKAFVVRLEGTHTVETVVTDVEAAGKSALSYIQAQGLQQAYNITVTTLASIATGTAPETIVANVLAALEAAGVAIAKGAENVLIGQAQADLAASSLAAGA